MKRVKLDRQDAKIKKFVRSLASNAGGSILELEGKPLLQILPINEEPVDPVKLKAAIRKRRDKSRLLNKDWDAVDQEMWNRLPE